MKNKHKKTYIYGKHAVMEALVQKPSALQKVFLAPTIHDEELRELLKKKGIRTAPLSQGALEKGIEEAAHQGVIGVVSPGTLMVSYDDFVKDLAPNADTALVLLDEIQDPHNVGAIIRSAAAFGAQGVLIPEHNQAGITGAVVKVSAGMAFRIPLVAISNVNMTLRDLKEKGFWMYGLEGDAEKTVADERFDAPAVFIFGNESKGIRLKTRELCDVLLSIPIHPHCESLNVAASAAVTLYAWSAQHPQAAHAKH
ncbi:MAG: 23S rRNA (guanosine(2251)-2'-O)-methyltransferase RlmB [Patescibacteria group bacterium]